jgi:hypothetical protein
VNAISVLPRESRDWTVADLDGLPDDGRASGSEELRVETPFPLVITPSTLVNR